MKLEEIRKRYSFRRNPVPVPGKDGHPTKRKWHLEYQRKDGEPRKTLCGVLIGTPKPGKPRIEASALTDRVQDATCTGCRAKVPGLEQ